ncbi:MAG TPA: O-antigen ligase family protein [Ktedonobacteraceae bacterium]|nr:O-antigen ligase family protein [Ktedonobacteraceae bacterium]
MRQRVDIKESKTAQMIGLLILGGVLGLGLALEAGKLGSRDMYLWGSIIGSLALVSIIMLRYDEFMAGLLVAVHLYIDWYLALYVVALGMALILLLSFYLLRSVRHPWVEPRAIWLWGLLLLLTLVPAIQGATNFYDATYYYPNLIVGALVIFWIGAVTARNGVALRRLCCVITAIGALVALHTIIQEVTGTFLLASSHYDTVLNNVSNYQIAGSDAHRVGSFFVDPNWDGTFLAMMLCLELGLFVECQSFAGKVCYLAEIALTVPAVLFTLSTGALIGTFAGVIVFFLFVGQAVYRIVLPLLAVAVIMALFILLPSHLLLQAQHASGPEEVMLRVGAWSTALRVIAAFPLTGVGLGLYTYLATSERYRVPAQTIPLAHPHNSYLELAAMAGIPVLLVFVCLVACGLWYAWRNWLGADIRTRSLIGAGMAAVIALSVNSFSINGWTLPPLAATGWLILGAIASPLLKKTSLRTTGE